MFNFSNDDFETKGNALATLKASVLSAFSNQAEKEKKRISKNRMLGFSKLVGTIEKNILLKKIDFWLPLRVHCTSSQLGAKNTTNSSIANSREKYHKPTVLKLQLNNDVFDDENVKDRLIHEFSHKVSLRKVSDVTEESKVAAENSMVFNDLALCDISVIDHNKVAYDDVDKKFRTLAFQNESVLNQTELDIFTEINKSSPSPKKTPDNQKLVYQGEYLSPMSSGGKPVQK
jgi:hypothetical protein